ncbi:hypothetical protein ACO2Q8_29075 [Larkinella sp. VNQ87]|uniref:hypothetical protein n=1 Tax=Larkinella sp. VNQ87 TaxID=3400921 RepID=UPI003BFE4631
MEDSILSPNGTFSIIFDTFEVRMSHWIQAPRVFRVQDQAQLFDLQGDVWSADKVTWLSDSEVELYVRKYPGQVSCDLVLDLAEGTGKAICGQDRFAGPLIAVKAWVLHH